MNILRWMLFWMPLWMGVPAIFVVSTRPPSPRLVLRPDMMAAVGVPTLVLWLSLLVAVLYLGALCTVLRPQWSALAKVQQGGYLSLLMVLFAAIGVWALFDWSNGAWTGAPLEIHRSRVIGTYQNSKTPYLELQDWRNPNALVYLPFDRELLRQSPPQSEIEVQTQRGFWGYELIYGTRPASAQGAN